MRRLAVLLATALLSLCLLCSCGASEPEPINEGETYLEGVWYLEEGGLHVGYHLFSNGSGFLFIGETAVPIRYGISDGYLYVADNGNVESLPFLASDDGLWIDGMLFRPVAEDPEISAAVEALRSEAQQASAAPESFPQIGKTVVQLITLAAAAGVVVILVQFLRKRKRS